jgi:hypothetical protein
MQIGDRVKPNHAYRRLLGGRYWRPDFEDIGVVIKEPYWENEWSATKSATMVVVRWLGTPNLEDDVPIESLIVYNNGVELFMETL